MPYYYCDACKAEYEKRRRDETERRTKKQRAQYARRRKRVLAHRPPAICPECQKEFERKRSDARFCSDRCRQKAHRAAITLNSSPGVLVLTVTNVGAPSSP